MRVCIIAVCSSTRRRERYYAEASVLFYKLEGMVLCKCHVLEGGITTALGDQ